MAISRRRRYDPARVRHAQLEGARLRLRDLTEHRLDLGDDERARLIAETEARITQLESEQAVTPTRRGTRRRPSAP